METNEIMTNEEVVEVADEVTANKGGKGFMIVAGIGAAILVGGLAYKYVAKPLVAKIKAAKEKQESFDTTGAVEVEYSEESDENSDN